MCSLLGHVQLANPDKYPDQLIPISCLQALMAELLHVARLYAVKPKNLNGHITMGIFLPAVKIVYWR